jgi:nucleoside triphosphate pyrophosphatase
VRLILASASPRRAELLRAAGIEVDVHPAHVDESVRPGEHPEVYAARVALAKARSVSQQMPDRFVLGADTVVVIEDRILGKPVDSADARQMLRLLSGRPHVVITAVVLIRNGGSTRETADVNLERTTVEFAALSKDEIDWYAATSEPMDKAGGYAIQGLASRFVTRIDGSYSNVVGLPVSLVYGMCKRAGLLLS